MKEHINKIILVVIITLSVAATWLYTNPGNVATYYDFINEYNYGNGTFSYEPANEKEEKVPIPSVKKEESPKKEEKKKNKRKSRGCPGFFRIFSEYTQHFLQNRRRL